MNKELVNKLTLALDNIQEVIDVLVKMDSDQERKVKCECCGWEGEEKELVPSYYDSCNSTNDDLLCPNCGNNID